MKTRFYLLLPLLVVLFNRCAEEIPPTDAIFDSKKTLQERLQIAFSEGVVENMGITTEMANALQDFYSKRQFQPVWSNDSILASNGKKLTALLNESNALGLPKNRLLAQGKKDISKKIIVKELLLTAKLSQIATDLKVGIMDTSKNALRPITPTSTENLTRLVSEFNGVKDYAVWFSEMGPEMKDYRSLSKALFYFAQHKTFSAKSFKIPEMKKDSAQCVELAKASLIDKGYLEASAVADTSFESALKRFQVDNGMKPDAKIGDYTRKALEESAQTKVDRTILSLERWRWRSKFPDRYIWINIPEYVLRVYYNDTLFSVHKVVVGKNDTRTPQLTSKIRTIMALPYWTQPQSIASKEFLPSMQNNSGYAKRNNYKIYRGDKEIDPSTVNWKKYKEKSFPFRIRQEPGNNNALGLIKFEFSNKFGVYVHDTPSKGFFNRDIRSFSHGCVRCQMPDSLARFILRRDEKQEVLPDSLDSIISRKEHTPIYLHKPINIQIDYITVGLDPVWNLVFYPDIYKKDDEYLKWMLK